MSKTTSNSKVKELVFLAVLIALVVFMTLTGFAYIPINAVFKITLLTIPVAISGIVCGVQGGAILGTVFGLTSFSTCVFATDPFGAILFGISPIKTFIFCVIPRILCGLIPALIYKSMKNKNIAIPISCTLTAVLNTVGFLTTLWLCFGNDLLNNAQVVEFFTAGGISITGILSLFVVFAGVNAIIEAASNLVIGTAATKVVLKLWK